MLEMVGVNMHEPSSQYEHHRFQERDPQSPPPLCINKDTCTGLYHLYPDFQAISNDEKYYMTWMN